MQIILNNILYTIMFNVFKHMFVIIIPIFIGCARKNSQNILLTETLFDKNIF